MRLSRNLKKNALMVLVIVLAFSIVVGVTRNRTKVRVEAVGLGGFSDDIRAVVARANQQIHDELVQAGLAASSPADPLVVASRISLGLVGCRLSLEEIRAFQSVSPDRQIEWVTEYLLQDRRWADYFAERFSRAMLGTDEGPFLLFRRRRFNAWLADQLHQDVGYDTIVRSVIGSEGLWTDTPSVNFITASMTNENDGRCDPIVLAGRTSRTFLAQRIDCLQCHDDFLDQHNFGTEDDPVLGKQEHFHQLAAFFGTTGIKDNPFSGIRDVGGQYETQLLGESEPSAVTAEVPFSQQLLPVDGRPRRRLAAWVTHPENRAFARAAVNRVWALMYSRPLVEPVDSIPMDAEVPPVLDLLAEDFAKNGFKLRRLVRTIVGMESFQRDSRADFEITAEHERALAVFPITQLRPDQVAGSLVQASRLSAIDADSSVLVRLIRFGNTNEFLRDFGDRGVDEFQSEAITIPQRLVLLNGNLMTERTREDLVANAATRIARLVRDDKKAVESIYLSVFGRYPTTSESERLVQLLSGKRGQSRVSAVNDIYWAMMNSTEFSWNH